MADEGEKLFEDLVAEMPPVEEAPEPAPEPEPEPQQPEPEPVPEPTPQPERPEPGYVPIAAMMDERDKRRALEAELAQFRQQKPTQAPDPYDDPHGFAQHQTAQVDQMLTQQRFAMSDMFARQAHGAEVVDKAVEWAQSRAQQDPAFAQSYMRQQNPIDWIVRQHKRDEMMGQIGDRPLDDFVRDYIARNPDKFAPASVAAAPASAAVVTPQQASPPARVPPRSLATQGSGPSDVRDVATGPLAGVDAVFPQ